MAIEVSVVVRRQDELDGGETVLATRQHEQENSLLRHEDSKTFCANLLAIATRGSLATPGTQITTTPEPGVVHGAGKDRVGASPHF